MSSSEGTNQADSSPEPLSPVLPLELRSSPPPVKPLFPLTGKPPGPVLPAAPAMMNVPALLRAFRARWLLAVSAGLALAAAGVAGARALLPPVSTVSATLLLASTPPKVLPWNRMPENDENPNDLLNFQKTQAALITTGPVLNEALQQPGVSELSLVRQQADPYTWLEKEVNVNIRMGPHIIGVSMRGNHPRQLVVLVNAVAQAYLEEIVYKESNKRKAHLKQLEGIYEKYEKSLKEKRKAYEEFAKKAGSPDPQVLAVSQQAAYEQLGRARNEMLQRRAELRNLELEVMGGDNENGPPEPLSDEQLKLDPIAADLFKQIGEKEAEVERYRGVAARGENEPRLVRCRQELAALKRSLESRREGVEAQRARQAPFRMQGERQGDRARRQERIGVLKELDQMLTKDVDRLTREIQGQGMAALKVAALREEIAQTTSSASKVAEQAEALRVEINAPPRVTLWEAAKVTPPDKKWRYGGMLGGGGLGLLLGVAGVSLLELRARRIRAAEEVAEGLGVTVLGSLPRLTRARLPQALAGAGAGSRPNRQPQLVEWVDTTRSMVLHAARGDALRVILITSAMGGEGKTSLSSHLAVSLARSGRRVVLVDTDLRRPAVHRVFGVNQAPGLDDLLRGKASVDEVVQGTWVEGLWVITAGRADPQSFDALARERVRPILDELKAKFDMVVVDSCPVLPVADVLLIAPHVDGVVFSVLQEVSRMPAVHSAWNRLAWLGVRMLGVVISGARDTHTYGYY